MVTLYLPSCCSTGGAAHAVVLLWTATQVDNRIIFDIMLNIIIAVVIFIISPIKRIAATITIATQPSSLSVVIHV